VNIRPAQFSVLVVIEANPGLSQSELADLLGIERGRLVWLLDSLEKRRFIRRLPSASDRRSHALLLTRAGEQRMKRIKALAAEHEARLIERVGPQKWETLIDILKDFDPTPPRSSENDDPARRSVRVAARDRD
jgi:DNA-binding MarR family transcriptional regulator